MTITDLIAKISGWVSDILPILVGLALLGFFWGLVELILSAGDEGKRDEGKKKMIYGLIALFVMVSVWGLVSFIGNSLGIESGGILQVQYP